MRTIGRWVLVLAFVGLCSAATAQAGKSAGGSGLADAITASAVNRLWATTDRHWHEGEYNHIIHLCKIVTAGDPEHVEAYSNAGWLLWSMDRDDEAAAIYEDGVKNNRKTYYMYHEAAYFYTQRKKDWKKALIYLEPMAKCKDVTMPGMHMLAHAYEKTGQPLKALEIWKRAAEDTENGAARHNLNRLQKQLATKGR